MDPFTEREKRMRGRTIRFTDEEIRDLDHLAVLKDLPSSIIVRKFLRALIDRPRLQRAILGADVTHKVSA
jgi:predicted transcriptional regulator